MQTKIFPSNNPAEAVKVPIIAAYDNRQHDHSNVWFNRQRRHDAIFVLLQP